MRVNEPIREVGTNNSVRNTNKVYCKKDIKLIFCPGLIVTKRMDHCNKFQTIVMGKQYYIFSDKGLFV